MSVDALRARARRAKPGLWLAGIVCCSIVAEAVLARRIVAPWIIIDELVYSELAQSFATHGEFLLRGVHSSGYGVVYPVLVAPAWWLFGAMPTVYMAAKTINCIVMSLAAIPAYLLARRLLPAGLSLVVAALTVMVPDMLYTGMIMTESAFYPLFVTLVLLLQLTLERPTVKRQIALLAVFAVAYETRAQAVAVFAAIATAPLMFALIRGEGVRRSLAPFRLLYGLIALGAGGALIVVTVVRGESPQSLLGAYAAATNSSYTLSGVAHYLVYHIAEFDLLTGVIPFAALVALWLSTRRGADRALTAFAVTSAAVSAWLLVEVSAYASGTGLSLRIEERYDFYLVPFAFIALVALAHRGIVPERRPAVYAAALIAGIAPFFTDFSHFISDSAVSDSFALLPWWWTIEHGLPLPDVRFAALGVSLAAAAAFVLTPRRYALALAAVVGAYLVAVTAVVDNGRFSIHIDSVGTLMAATKLSPPDWIDRAVGTDASVVALWTGTTNAYPIWVDGFFNRSLGTVYDVDGASQPDTLPEVPATIRSSGALDSDGHPVDAAYVLAPGSAVVSGEVVARDPIGYVLYRVNGPIVILTRVSGIYGDSWSGKTATYARAECTGGTVAVRLQSDPNLFRITQTVIARESGTIVARAQITPTGESTLIVPLHREAGDRCTVTFTAVHTAVPSLVQPGSTDTRVLGARFLSFSYRP